MHGPTSGYVLKMRNGQLVFDHECDVATFCTINLFFFPIDPTNSTIGPVSNSFGVSISA